LKYFSQLNTLRKSTKQIDYANLYNKL